LLVVVDEISYSHLDRVIDETIHFEFPAEDLVIFAFWNVSVVPDIVEVFAGQEAFVV
jgi:hypothetical protein